VIKKKYGQDAVNVGDEGGFAPNILNTSDAVDLIMESIENVGYLRQFDLAMDVAASEFYNKEENKYDLNYKS